MLKRLDWLSETMATGACRVLCTCISMSVNTGVRRLEFSSLQFSSVQFVRCEHAFSPPALREAQARWAYVLLMFFIFKIFLVTCHTNYLSIYRTDLHEICRIGRTLAADERPIVIFRSLKGRCRGNQFCGQNRPPFHTL